MQNLTNPISLHFVDYGMFFSSLTLRNNFVFQRSVELIICGIGSDFLNELDITKTFNRNPVTLTDYLY
jgi:hypothetical protein